MNVGYPDLIIGAYESDSVVFVRSRAVVKTWLKSQTTPRLIDLRDPAAYCEKGGKVTCMSFEVCAQYFGKEVSKSLRMEIGLELDFEKSGNWSQRRGYFNETGLPVLMYNYTFQFDKQGNVFMTLGCHCLQPSCFIRNEIALLCIRGVHSQMGTKFEIS